MTCGRHGWRDGLDLPSASRFRLLDTMNASTVALVDPAVFGDGSGYPAQTWTVVPSPSMLGWSEEKLAEARQFSDQIESDAVVVVDQGIVVAQWGEVARSTWRAGATATLST